MTRTVPLGSTGRAVPNVVLGLMRIAELSDDAVRELVGAAPRDPSGCVRRRPALTCR